jgi:hypothetical protein
MQNNHPKANLIQKCHTFSRFYIIPVIRYSDHSHSEIGRILENSGIGRLENGRLKIGRSELGRSENGRSEIGRSEIGRSENGRSEIGRCTKVYICTCNLGKCRPVSWVCVPAGHQ